MWLSYNFNYILGKIEDNFKGFQKIKAQKSLYRAFWRKTMTDNLKFFSRETKAGEFRDNYDRADYRAAAGCDFCCLFGMDRVYPNTLSSLLRNYGFSAAGVKSHFQKNGLAFTDEAGSANYQPLFRINFEFAHGLECGDKTLRHSIFGIGDENRPPSFYGEEFFVNFISVWAMNNEPTRYGGSSRFVNFIQSNKQPLAMITFLYTLNFFNFHDFYLDKDNNIEKFDSQAKYGMLKRREKQ